MAQGSCRLCLTPNVELRNSHFMSAGFYKLARDESRSNPNPVLVSEQVSLLSSEQAKDYLLCAECEDRFNLGGEAWVLGNCWHSESDFPLREALLATTPSPLSSPDFTIFKGAGAAGVEPDKLSYFGSSIFWRGASHDWVFMRRNPKRLELGPYEEPLRRFLVGDPFPKDIVLIVSVTSGMERIRNMLMVLPFIKSRDAGFRQYRFTIPGITFQLFVGKEMPAELRRLSIQEPERHILMTPDVDELNMSDGAKLILEDAQGRCARATGAGQESSTIGTWHGDVLRRLGARAGAMSSRRSRPITNRAAVKAPVGSLTVRPGESRRVGGHMGDTTSIEWTDPTWNAVTGCTKVSPGYRVLAE